MLPKMYVTNACVVVCGYGYFVPQRNRIVIVWFVRRTRRFYLPRCKLMCLNDHKTKIKQFAFAVYHTADKSVTSKRVELVTASNDESR